MSTRPTMKKTVLTYGLIAGAIMSAMLLVIVPFKQQVGFDRAAVLGYASMIAAFLLVFFGVRAYRDEVAGGTVSFGRALAVGLLIVAVGSACYVVTWEIMYYTIASDFMVEYQAYALQKLQAQGASAAEVAAEQAKMARFAELYRNPLVNAAITFLEPLPVGVVASLVSAGILGRRGGGRAREKALAGVA